MTAGRNKAWLKETQKFKQPAPPNNGTLFLAETLELFVPKHRYWETANSVAYFLYLPHGFKKLRTLFPTIDISSTLIGKDLDAERDWGQEEKGATEDEMAGWHHWHDGHEFE